MAQQIALGSLSHKQNNIQCHSPSKQVRKLKIQLSDRIFQLKKLQQDYAQQKAHILMQFAHQRTALNNTIRQLRDKMQQENQLWVIKVDQIRSDNKQLIKQINQKWRNKVEGQVNQQVKQFKYKYEIQLQELSMTIAKLTDLLKQKQKSYQKILYELKQINKQNMSNLSQQKQAQLQQIRKKLLHDEQLKINAVMHIKNSQQKQHTHTKNLLLKRQREYNQNISRLEQKNFALGQQIWSLKNQINNLTVLNEEKTEQIVKLVEKSKNTVQMTSKQYEQKIQGTQKQWKQNIQSLNQKWKCQYKKLQIAYQKVTVACAQKQKLWQQRGNKVLKLYQTRQARQQDMKLIQHLQVQLIKKQFELQRQKQELKSCKLQLDNMDDIYKRIFHSVKKNHRHSHSFQLKKVRLPGINNKSTYPVKEQE